MTFILFRLAKIYFGNIVYPVSYTAIVLGIVLYVISLWLIFKKANVAAWKSIIPIYDVYNEYKICWSAKAFIGLCVLAILYSSLLIIGIYKPPLFGLNAQHIYNFTIAAISLIEIIFVCMWAMQNFFLSKSFGKGFVFALGLIFFKPIFMLILGLGSSSYIGNANSILAN